ncbi:MAG: cytochrome b5 domain-containing protein [Thermodesulfobacteriota bacterium]
MNKSNYILIILAILILAISFSIHGNATEEYAGATGSECKVCHIDPLWGGDLTQVGQGYYLSVSPGAEQNKANKGSMSWLFKLVIGYIHIVTAFMWFGTILYVHLVLKPAYASQGLPRGEVKVGIASMAIMATTGSILTYYKVPSFGLLLSSQFGILLLIKMVVFSIMVLSAIFVVLVIGPKLKKKKKVSASMADALTPSELTNFDGEEGRPVYFAYKGKIYDVTQSKLWRNGNHMKRHHAGVDLTEVLAQAPHSENEILAMPEVGQLSEGKESPPAEIHKKIFYVMAYMNLGFVFVITLILALWRWY